MTYSEELKKAKEEKQKESINNLSAVERKERKILDIKGSKIRMYNMTADMFLCERMSKKVQEDEK